MEPTVNILSLRLLGASLLKNNEHELSSHYPRSNFPSLNCTFTPSIIIIVCFYLEDPGKMGHCSGILEAN